MMGKSALASSSLKIFKDGDLFGGDAALSTVFVQEGRVPLNGVERGLTRLIAKYL